MSRRRSVAVPPLDRAASRQAATCSATSAWTARPGQELDRAAVGDKASGGPALGDHVDEGAAGLGEVDGQLQRPAPEPPGQVIGIHPSLPPFDSGCPARNPGPGPQTDPGPRPTTGSDQPKGRI